MCLLNHNQARVSETILSKPAPFRNELQRFAFVSHEIGTTVPRHHNGAARVAHARGFVMAPAFDQAVNKTGGEGVTRAEDVINLDRKSGHILRGFSLLEYSGASLAALHDNHSGTAPVHG